MSVLAKMWTVHITSFSAPPPIITTWIQVRRPRRSQSASYCICYSKCLHSHFFHVIWKQHVFWINKSVVYYFLKLLAVPTSCFPIRGKHYYTALILGGCYFKNFVTHFHTTLWTANQHIDLCLISISWLPAVLISDFSAVKLIVSFFLFANHWTC